MPDKRLLYIGNKLSKYGRNETGVEFTGRLLAKKYQIKGCSDKLNPIMRLIDILYHVLKFRTKTDIYLIDVYSSKNFYVTLLSVILIKLLKKKYITVLHGGDLPHRLSKSPGLCEYIFNLSLANTAPSIYMKEEFKKYNFSVEYIPNSIPLENYPFKTRETFSPNLLYVRAFHSIYNPTMAIEVIHKLREIGCKAQLTMVGPDKDGSLKTCKDLCAKYNLESQITFTGKLPKSEWVGMAKDFDIFLNTTNYDNSPVSVIEAMCLGLLVISTNAGGLPYIIENGHNGLLVNKNDFEKMADLIQDATQNPHKYVSIPKYAKTKMEIYDEDRVLGLWEKVIEA